MPFKSHAQRRFMYAKYPEIAKKWSEHTPKGAKLPEKLTDSDPEETKRKAEKSEKKSSVLSLVVLKSAETQPPGLRQSGALGDSSCQACRHFDSQGICSKYEYPVQPTQVCDVFEPIDVGTDKIVSPEEPMRAIAQGPEEMGLPGGEEMELPDATMDAVKNFKFAFLYRCAEHGLSRKEVLNKVKQAYEVLNAAHEKQAISIGNVLKPLLDTGVILGFGIPAGLGALGGYALRKIPDLLTRSPITERFKRQRKRELADKYTRLADEVEYKKKLRAAAGRTGLIRLS